MLTNNLATIMEEKGIKSIDLSKMTGLRQSTISQIKNGHRAGKITSLLKIADALGCEVGALFPAQN